MAYYSTRIRRALKEAFPHMKLKVTSNNDPSGFCIEIYIQSGKDDIVYPDEAAKKYGFFPATIENMSNPEWMMTESWKDIAHIRQIVQSHLDARELKAGSYKIYVGESPHKGYNK